MSLKLFTVLRFFFFCLQQPINSLEYHVEKVFFIAYLSNGGGLLNSAHLPPYNMQ